MLSETVWGGVLHCHINNAGGRSATPASSVHADDVWKLAAIPAAQTAEVQKAAAVALTKLCCMFTV
jgi:hypothetical protein